MHRFSSLKKQLFRSCTHLFYTYTEAFIFYSLIFLKKKTNSYLPQEKQKMEKKPFVFNDENQTNSYGFSIITQGIDTTRFGANPVMLSNHSNMTDHVIGKWENWQVQQGKLLGYPVFDMEDQTGKSIAGKVERGFLSGCSMGIMFDPNDLVHMGDKIVLTKCELTEVSIVAIPSNKNSVQLYNQNHELYDTQEIQALCLCLEAKKTALKPNNNMKKIQLSISALVALGFTDTDKEGVEEALLEQKILSLFQKNQVLEAENTALLAEKEAEKQKAITDMVTTALQQGRITADKQAQFINLAKADFELAKNTLEMLPSRGSLISQVANPKGTADISKEAFLKLSLTDQLAFKAENPDQYKKMFNTKIK